MFEVRQFEKEKLVVPLLISDADMIPKVKQELERNFGPIDYEGGPIPFTFTDYYDAEMGKNIQRVFLAFQLLIDPAQLASVKLRTNEIEKTFAVRGNRRVNLDPGILNLTRFVLATTKNAPHRIPLSDGIYGEITLIYLRKDFQNLFWTYPDFRTEIYKRILREIREIYRKNLKQEER